LCESTLFHPKLLDIIKFTPEDVYEELVNLQCDKACGPDCIPAQSLKAGADFISLPLSKLFQLSLDSGSLPRDWVTANIIPVHKKGDKHLSSNYHPISRTSIVIKVMKRINLPQLWNPAIRVFEINIPLSLSSSFLFMIGGIDIILFTAFYSTL